MASTTTNTVVSLVGIFDPRDVKRKEPGLFALSSLGGEEYYTYNRILTTEIARFFPGRSRSEKVTIAKQLLSQSREEEHQRQGSATARSSPAILEISNAIARDIEAYKLPDQQTRLALRKSFVCTWLQSFDPTPK